MATDPSDTNPAVPLQEWGKFGWVSQRPWLALAISATALSLIGLLIPKLYQAEAMANLVQSNSNLKQIGLGIALYSNEHNGQYPDSFGTLLAAEYLNVYVFVSPQSNDTPAHGATTQAVLADLAKPGHSSYH
jgi:hypothetical protein